MIKFRKKLLAVLLTAAMLISMSSVVAWSDEQPADEQSRQPRKIKLPKAKTARTTKRTRRMFPVPMKKALPR